MNYDNIKKKDVKQITLNHITLYIQGFHLIFFDWESFPEYNSLDILALCETNLDDSVDSANFSVRYYLPLIQ